MNSLLCNCMSTILYHQLRRFWAVLPTLHGYPTAPTRGSPSDRKSSQNSSLHAQLYPTVTHEANICSKESWSFIKLYFPLWGSIPKILTSKTVFAKTGGWTKYCAWRSKSAVWYVRSELAIALVAHGVVCVLSCFVIVKLLPLILSFFFKKDTVTWVQHTWPKILAKNGERYDD